MPVRGIKSILAYHYAIITLIPFLLIIFFSMIVIFPREKAEAENHHRQLAAAIDEKIESFLKGQIADIASINPGSLKTADLQALLDRVVEESESINALYLVSKSGLIRKVGISFKHVDSLHQDLESVDISRSDVFKKVVSQNKPVWSEIFLSVVSGSQAIAYALPIGDAYLIGEVSLIEFNKYLQRISLADNSLVFITDRLGQVIASKGGLNRSVLTNISNQELIKNARNRSPATGRFRFEDNEYVGSVSTMKSLGWHSLLATPANDVFVNAYNTTKIILVGLLASLVLAAWSAHQLLKKFAAQFEKLSGYTRQIAMHGIQDDWSGGDVREFKQIIESLHQMSDILLERESAIFDGLNYIKMDKIRFECLYELSRKEGSSEKEILDYALEAAVRVSESRIGYIYSLNDEETVLTLHAWSKDVITECSIPAPPSTYLVAETGLWGEAIRQRKAVITNDYSAPHPSKKGYPAGHVAITRHMNVPIFYQGKIVLLVGVGNKTGAYDDEDIGHLSLLLDATWIMIQKKRSETLLEESEERSLQMFQQNDDSLVFFRLPSLKPLDANPATFRMLGISQYDITHVVLRKMLGRTGIKRLAAAVRAAESDFIIDRLNCRRTDGSCIVISIRGRVLNLKRERVLFCSMRDMTSKFRLEEEMKTTHAKLIQANKMSSLGLLVSSIAHEINNPNQSVGMNAFIMGRVWRDAALQLQDYYGDDESFLIDGVPFGEMKETVPQMIEAIAQGSRRIDSYIQRLMGFVRDGKGRLDSVVDVNRSIENVISILWYQIRSGTENFQTLLSGKNPLAVGNAQQIEQVIINLITNALQSLTSLSAAVVVETDISADGREVIITVRDEGRGMSHAILEKIAEPFFSTRQEQGGTGLGVYITANIVREHQGKIEYDSMIDRGTTATVRLPASTDE